MRVVILMGQIDPDGPVGAIGGVRQRDAGDRKAGGQQEHCSGGGQGRAPPAPPATRDRLHARARRGQDRAQLSSRDGAVDPTDVGVAHRIRELRIELRLIVRRHEAGFAG